MSAYTPLKSWGDPEHRRATKPVQKTIIDMGAKKANGAVPEWPISGQSLKKNYLGLIGEVALLLLPAAFMALAAVAWSFDKKPISDHGKNLQRAMNLGPTIFPLAFAAVGGRGLRNIARWKIERGSTLGTLEKLNGSQSLVSALTIAIALRSFNLLSIAVLLFWCLSPLGGQSSLRLITEVNSTTTTTKAVYYAGDHALNWLEVTWGLNIFPQVDSIVSTSISTSNVLQNNSMDVWNHAKIPRLLEFEAPSIQNRTTDSWIDVDTTRNIPYTSLTGIGVSGLEPHTEADFTVPYSYLFTTCTSYTRADENATRAFLESIARNHSYLQPDYWWHNILSTKSPYQSVFNVSAIVPPPQYRFDYNSTFFLSGAYNGMHSLYTSGNIYFGTRDLNRTISVYTCSLNSTMVEARIHCTSASESSSSVACRVYQLRQPTTQPDYTGQVDFDTPWAAANIDHRSRVFFEWIPSLGGVLDSSSSASHPVDNYIYGDTSLPYFSSYEMHRDWSTVSTAQVSQRLTEILNTYWNSARWVNPAAQMDPYGKTLIDPKTGKPYEYAAMNGTDAIISRRIEVYKASVPWILTLLFCSVTLLFLGIANVVVFYVASAPDVLGYVSSLTRGNPHVAIPDTGSALDGKERARLLKNLEVRLGDVREDKALGYLALEGPRIDSTKVEGRIQRDKVYL